MKKRLIFAGVLFVFIIVLSFGIIFLDYNSSFSETHGRIVDENGKGISNLNITFFYVRSTVLAKTFSPVLIKRINSDENGEFYTDSLDIKTDYLYFKHYKRVQISKDYPPCSGKLICPMEGSFTKTRDISSKAKKVTIILNRTLLDEQVCYCNSQN